MLQYENEHILAADKEKSEHLRENLFDLPLFLSSSTVHPARGSISLLPYPTPAWCPLAGLVRKTSAPCVPPTLPENETRSWSCLVFSTRHTTTTTPCLVYLLLMQVGNRGKGLPRGLEVCGLSRCGLSRCGLSKCVVVVVVVIVVDGCTWPSQHITHPLDRGVKKV